MKKIYFLFLVLFAIPGLVLCQLSWEVSTVTSPVSSYRGATAVYTNLNKQWVLVFGGWSTSSGNFNENYVYDYESDSWYEGYTIPENTKGGAAVYDAYNYSYIYLLTGNDGADNNINSKIFLRLNVESATWEYMAEYPIAARYVSMAINPNNSLIYCAGGSGDNYAAVDQVNVYDPSNDSWTSCTSLPYPSSGGSALIFSGQHLYLMGGLINQPYDKVFKGLVDINDPTIINWVPGASIPVEMAKISAGYIGNGQILATDLDGTFIYDISLDIWTDVDNKPSPVKGGNYVSIPIDGVYSFTVAGGKDSDDNLVDHVEYLAGELNTKFPATFVLTMNGGEPAVNAIIEVAGFTLHTDEAGAAVQFLENGTYDYIATYDNLISSGTFVIENNGEYISCELIVGIEENVKHLSIYPNPGNGIFKLQGVANTNIEVIDVKGRLIYNNSEIDNNCVIDISGSDPGIYFVKIIRGDGSISMKKIVLE